MNVPNTMLGVCVMAMISIGCSDSDPKQIGGVSGVAEAGGKSLPERTALTFIKIDDVEAGASFTTYVDGSGHYSYKPVAEVPIAIGSYKVVLKAPGVKSILNEIGMFVPDPKENKVVLEVDKKYLNKATSPLEVKLTEDPVVFDIKL